jgi:CheY-like chemotaxis protein
MPSRMFDSARVKVPGILSGLSATSDQSHGQDSDGASPEEELMMPADCSRPADVTRVPPPILVADDDEMLAVAVRGLLQSLGHSVDAVTDGREAVAAAAREDFDLVFLDVQMPVMGGFEAARMLRREHSRGREPRIIGVLGEREEREAYAGAGMDDFLVKPVRLADLVPIIGHYGRS